MTTLERFCQAVNEKDWGYRAVAVTIPDPNINPPEKPYLFIKDRENYPRTSWATGLSDEENAHFIIWGLDRLEELGEGPNLYTNVEGGKYSVSIASAPATQSDSRSQAIFSALCRVLGVEE